MKLSVKQKLFCEFYVSNGGNGTQAAKDAGYKNHQQVASENLLKLVIQLYIEELTKDAKSSRIATAEENQEFWTSVLRGEEPTGKDSEGNDTFDMKDRLKASELLGKSQGQFIDKKEITGKDGGAMDVGIKVTFE